MDRDEGSSDVSMMTEHDLESMENSYADNATDLSKSSVLGPYNTIKKDELEDEFELEEKIIKFKPKLREIDRRYERDNNSNVDNGMYLETKIKPTSIKRKPNKKIQRGLISNMITKYR